MPANLKLFECLAYLGIFVNTAMFSIENAGPAGAHYGALAMIGLVAATLATGVVFISVMVRFRINWLRWLNTAFLLVSLAANVWLTPDTFAKSGNGWMQLLTICYIVLNAACVYLLMSRPAGEWFRGGIGSGNRASA